MRRTQQHPATSAWPTGRPAGTCPPGGYNRQTCGARARAATSPTKHCRDAPREAQWNFTGTKTTVVDSFSMVCSLVGCGAGGRTPLGVPSDRAIARANLRETARQARSTMEGV